MHSGIPHVVGEYTASFAYNDVESLERIFDEHPDDVAAIVTTPMHTSPPADDCIDQMREIADCEGAPLVFDESETHELFPYPESQD